MKFHLVSFCCHSFCSIMNWAYLKGCIKKRPGLTLVDMFIAHAHKTKTFP